MIEAGTKPSQNGRPKEKFEPNRLNRFSAILHTNLKNTVLRKTSSKFENGMNHCFDQPAAGAFRSCSSKTKLVSNKPF